MSERFQIRCQEMNAQAYAPWGGAGAERIAAWIDTVEAIGREVGFSLHADSQTWGLTVDELRERALTLRATRNRKAGYRALVAKYGEEIAKDIIARNKRA